MLRVALPPRLLTTPPQRALRGAFLCPEKPMELLNQQRPYYESLVGTDATPPAKRAWISLPMGAGKGVILAAAVQTLRGNGTATKVLYATHGCTVHAVKREFAEHAVETVDMTKRPATVAFTAGVGVCTLDGLTGGIDTWVEHGGFDLIVVDPVDQFVVYPTVRRSTALLHLLTMPCAVWLAGGSY